VRQEHADKKGPGLVMVPCGPICQASTSLNRILRNRCWPPRNRCSCHLATIAGS